MKIINRKGDLTKHLCTDCGGIIHGEYVEIVERGVRSYLHNYRCDRSALESIRELRRTARTEAMR